MHTKYYRLLCFESISIVIIDLHFPMFNIYEEILYAFKTQS